MVGISFGDGYHSTIIEFGKDMTSMRAEEAARRQRQLQVAGKAE